MRDEDKREPSEDEKAPASRRSSATAPFQRLERVVPDRRLWERRTAARDDPKEKE